MKFYLGTHQPSWMPRTKVPLFVSTRRLQKFKTLPVAAGRWALDSGGFTELSMHGRWTITPEEYARLAVRYQKEIGQMDWAAIQDWMCEPFILEKTGLSIREHQQRTILSYQVLLGLAPEIHWVPVLQGWQREDYLQHAEDYKAVGFDLAKVPLVGLGSVCRRQATTMVESLIRELTQEEGLSLHGFGFKKLGLRRVNHLLASSDSMAWSYAARRSDPLPGHEHQNCANCLIYALTWRYCLLADLKAKVTDL